jgi:hypothetical protein
MRESRPNILRNSKEEACGILLEASYCAEQEQGIRPLNQLLRVQDLNPEVQGRDYQGPWGLSLRRVTQYAENQTYFKHVPKKGRALARWTLCIQTEAHIQGGYMGDIPHWDKLPKPWEKEPFPSQAAWDDAGFLCTSNDPQMGALLTELHEALKNPSEKAIALWLGGAGNNPFARNGICLGLVDKIDPEQLQVAEDADKGRFELYWKAHDTGIPALIDKKRYYALAPGGRLKNRINPNAKGEDRKTPDVVETAYDIMFFLNPRDQQNHNSGWFTVEELRAWHEGKPSPVIKVQS